MMRLWGLGLLLVVTACSEASQEALGPGARRDAGPSDSGGRMDSGPDGGAGSGMDAAVQAATFLRFSLEEDSFYSFPFPSDRFFTEDGSVDLGRYPNPRDVGLISLYLSTAEAELDGFSVTPPVYFGFTGPLDPTSVTPVTDSLAADSNVVWVNVDPDSPEFGRRHAARSRVWNESSGRYLEPHTLTLTPVFSMPLAEGTTYAVFITNEVRDLEGLPVGAPEPLREALEGRGPFSELYAPLVEWAAQADQDLGFVAAATVFTTGHPSRQMSAVADFLRNESAPSVQQSAQPSPEVPPGYTLYEGSYLAANFQEGSKPYANAGGRWVFDDSGRPVVQSMEEIRFIISIPNGEPPEDGWPVVLYGHGTGGSATSFYRTGPENPAERLAEAGIAVMAIDQPLHGARAPPGTLNEVELNSFNVRNPDSFRSLFRQGAADVLQQHRFLTTNFALEDAQGDAIPIDTGRVGYLGHSQGGLTGVLAASYLPELSAVALSAAGAGLADSILLREDTAGQPFDFATLVAFLAQISDPAELDRGHPVLGLVQMVVEVTDPVVYAVQTQSPLGTGRPLDLLLTVGLEDDITPPITTENLAAAAALPIVEPRLRLSLGHSLLQIPSVSRPVAQNRRNAFGTGTGALAQFEDQGHFALFRDPEAADLVYGFLKSALRDALPQIGDGP